MDGHVPAWALRGEAFSAIGVLAAPLVFVSDFNAATRGDIGRGAIGQRGAAADDVVHEHELVFGAAVLKRGFEPVVLGFAERPVPCVERLIGIGHGVPERIERDEEGVAPFISVVVLQQAERATRVVHGRSVTGVEVVWHRRWVEGLPGLQVPGGDVVLLVGGGVEKVAILGLVIPLRVEERDAVTAALKLVAEEEGTIIHAWLVRSDTAEELRWNAGDTVSHLVSHEDVAEVNVDVGGVGGDVVHRAKEEMQVAIHIEMRVRSDGEDKVRAARSGGVEAALTTSFEVSRCRVAVTDAVVILSVRLKTADGDLNRVVELGLGRINGEQRDGRCCGVNARRGAVFDEGILIRVGDDVHGDTLVRRHAKELRVPDRRVSQRCIDGVSVAADGGSGGNGVVAVRGADAEIHGGAASLREDLRAIDAIARSSIAVQSVIEHRHQRGLRRRGGGDQDIVNVHARGANRGRCGIADGLPAELGRGAEFTADQIIVIGLEAVIDCRGGEGDLVWRGGVGKGGRANFKRGGGDGCFHCGVWRDIAARD